MTDAHWMIAAPSARFGRSPLRAVVDGVALVLFREGRAVRALPDRCPHRGVPLSMGTCVGGRVRCRYHGWTFDGAGQLVHVPSDECAAAARPLLRPYAALEQDGYIWVALADGAPERPPRLGLSAARQWTCHFEVPWQEARMDLAMGAGLPDAEPGEAELPDGSRLVVSAPDRFVWRRPEPHMVAVLVSEGPTRCRLEVSLAGRRWGRTPAWRGEGPSPLVPASMSTDAALRERYERWQQGSRQAAAEVTHG